MLENINGMETDFNRFCLLSIYQFNSDKFQHSIEKTAVS